MIEIGEHGDRRARRRDLAGIEQPLGDDAVDRRRDGGIALGFLERRDLRVDGGHARARGLDFLAPRSGAQPRDRFARARSRAPRAAATRSLATSLRVAASSRCFCEPELLCEQPLEPLKVRFGGGEIGLRGGDVGRRGGGLRLGLADVFAARAGLQQPQLRVGLRSLGLRALQREIDVARIEPRDDIALLHAIAFGDRHLDDAPADFRRDLHLGGVDLPRHARARRRRVFLTGAERDRRDNDRTLH